MKVILVNSVGKDDAGFYIIHSPSRWSAGVRSLANWFAYYPWELAYTSSLLKKYTNFKVKLLDPCLMRWDKKKTLNAILEQDPNWVIIESATRTIKEVLWVVRNIKGESKTKIVLVGAHASAFPEEVLKEGVDFVAVGEYEYTILELLQKGHGDSIPGLYPNPPRPLLDVNDLPWPEDDDIKRIAYASPGEPSSLYREIQAYGSRGCRSICNFCVARHLYYRRPNWRAREIDDIIAEISYLKEKYPEMEGIFFDEEVHNGNKEFIIGLCKAIVENDLYMLKFEAMCDLRLFDEEMVSVMAEAGYYQLRFGIETANLEVGKNIKKYIAPEKLYSILKLMKKYQMRTYGTFMFGALGSNIERDSETLELITQLMQDRLLDNVQLSIATPQPGTPFYQEVKEKGWLLPSEWNEYDGENRCLLNYDNYSFHEIEKMKEKALLLRDHLYLKQKIRSKEFIPWTLSRLAKFGLKALIFKLIRRIRRELNYFLLKFFCFNKSPHISQKRKLTC